MNKLASLSPADELKKVLAEKQKLEERIKELSKETRDGDLETVKQLCELHSFTATDLRGYLKTKTVKKTPRKSKPAPVEKK